MQNQRALRGPLFFVTGVAKVLRHLREASPVAQLVAMITAICQRR
jgi:hypothetical protein